MRAYTEKDLESFIEAKLLQNGYIKRESKDYDKNFCVDKELLKEFLQSTQKKALKELERKGKKEQELLELMVSEIKEKGILKALKSFIEIRGVKIHLAYPKPNSSANEKARENYEKNIFSITRQLYYSERNNNSLDMVIFLNGLPLITMELKNPLTGQRVQDALHQYKRDRDPKEKIFKRSVVHFALDCDEVYMSTKLEGATTKFLPFNRGLNNGSGEIGLECGAGNPTVADKMKTSYLWEEILQRDVLLDLLFKFVIENDKRTIFPRFHQFDVVKKLLKDTKEKGVGQRYLIQHSAGSGKSNSIAWLAHNLASLHRMENGREKNVFDSILVVTDRTVLDTQIQEIVKSFTRDKNLVECIRDGSRQLKHALEEGKKIIITTIQKFPYIVDEVRNLSHKNFAIIIDEAHSSQSGKNAEKMGEAIANKNDTKGEMDIETELLKIIENKKFQKNASYFAFTATPKPKTLEMFGTPCEVDGVQKFIPFHLYSMKQAIEEGFILDVLRGYIIYKSFYTILSKNDNQEYDKKQAGKKLMAYVTRHNKTIEKKAKIMIEHFFQTSCKKIGAKAKAMVVTNSREAAVKYYLFFKNYLQENYPQYKALVAFSGEKKVDGESYNEASLNGFSEDRLKDVFKKEDCYRFLIVAEKYQTGFDEPLLHTMYVDKRLDGINAVQTLSRLNRICKNKEDTCVLDFENKSEEIEKSFSTFYGQTHLKEPTDLDNIYKLKSNLLNYEIYTEDELKDFTNAILENQNEDEIHSKLDGMIKTYNTKSDEEKTEFYTKAKAYLREYSFLAQILPFNDIGLEKLHILLKMLITKIAPPHSKDLARGIINNVELDSIRVILKDKEDIKLKENEGEVSPSEADGNQKGEKEFELLSNIVKEFNAKHSDANLSMNKEITDELMKMKNNIVKNEMLREARGDDWHLKKNFEKIFDEEYAEFYFKNGSYLEQLDNAHEFRKKVYTVIYEMIDRNFKSSLSL